MLENGPIFMKYDIENGENVENVENVEKGPTFDENSPIFDQKSCHPYN